MIVKKEIDSLVYSVSNLTSNFYEILSKTILVTTIAWKLSISSFLQYLAQSFT